MKNFIVSGCGFMGGMHAQALEGIRGARVAAFVDVSAERARKLAAMLGGKIPCFTSLGDAMAAVDADAVNLCLPTMFHEPAALEAIGVGLPFFLEKPVALDLAAAIRIMEAGRKARVFAMVGHCIRFWPEYQELERTVRSGRLGKLLSLSLQRRSARPAGGWALDPQLSGGAAVDLHIHDTDFILHLLGKPEAVSSRMSGPDNSHIFTTCHFPDIAVVSEGGWDYPAKWGFQMAYQAVFERGALEFDSNRGIFLTPASGPRRPVAVRQPAAGKSRGSAGNISSLAGYHNELAYFVRCLAANQAPRIATLEQAAESLAVVLAEIHSARIGRRITIL